MCGVFWLLLPPGLLALMELVVKINTSMPNGTTQLHRLGTARLLERPMEQATIFPSTRAADLGAQAKHTWGMGELLHRPKNLGQLEAPFESFSSSDDKLVLERSQLGMTDSETKDFLQEF